MWWSRPTRGGGDAQMLEQAHERRWSGATEYPNRLEWIGVGRVKWQFWKWSAPKQALYL